MFVNPLQNNPSSEGRNPATPLQAWVRITSGNSRWVRGGSRPIGGRFNRRSSLKTKRPYATVLSCIESTTPPELLCDAELGDLSVIRSAGGVLTPIISDSIALVSTAPLILILGHQRCAIVEAAYHSLSTGETPPKNLRSIIQSLTPAYERAVKSGGAEPAETMMRHQVALTVRTLEVDPRLSPFVQSGALAVVGGYFSLDTGKIASLADPSASYL
ncbi:carbonic anhydrase [Streptomyces sp. 2231.1]|uniref:carbonic anhydrase n=1 Tax=Streptomyces sp. 2231.1 TaxID=1855347 RepID=UPI000B83E164|nr:carbonic anhydrase [Streptomyces sp. 2231.1]